MKILENFKTNFEKILSTFWNFFKQNL